MTFVSYAQNYEDVMLQRAFRTVETGFFIDVGANAPVGDSVTYLFYERGWRGVNIEPVSQWFEMLAEVRPDDINLNAAIADSADSLTLYDVPDTGLATADPAIAARHRLEGRTVLERKVPAYTLNAVCARHAPAVIQFLKIDVEGAEASVLRSIDLDRYRPQVILVEATLPNSTTVSYAEWEPLITGKRYDFVYFDGLNRFYAAQECAGLKAAFSAPPNVLDDFMQYREVMHRQAIERLQAQLDAERRVEAPPEFKPLDISVLEPLAWADGGTDGDAGKLLQIGAGLKLVRQQQERTEQAIWRLAQAQVKQTALEAERLRQQEAGYQRRIFELEQENRQTQQQLEQERRHWRQEYKELQRQHAAVLEDKAVIEHELRGVYGGMAWRITKPLRIAADHGKPLLRKIREGGGAWLRFTPESRPRRTARQLKRWLSPRLGQALRRGKDGLMRNPVTARYLQATLDRFPGLRQGLRSWANRSAQAETDVQAEQGKLSQQAARVYRALQPPQQ